MKLISATPITSSFNHKQSLRYGENSHQQAAFYTEQDAPEGTVSSATQLQGKALSFNNIADTDAALECVKSFVEPACVIVKHANPCGVAVADSIEQAYQRAFKTDPTSAFGGIIAFNRPLDEATAKAIIDQQFVEVIIAPSVSEAAQKRYRIEEKCSLISMWRVVGVNRAMGLQTCCWRSISARSRRTRCG